MTLPQLLSVIAGSLIGVFSVYFFIQCKTRRFRALFWLSIGMAMIYAGFRPALIEALGPDSVELRIRLVVALLSFIVLTVTLEAIRVAQMQERYAFLWLVTGLFLLAGAFFPDIAHAVSAATGISYGATVMVVVFAFVLLMLFHVSVALSKLQYKLSQVARELALTEERIRRMETGIKPGPHNRYPPP